MKPEYHKGPGAQKNFENTMRKLFRAPKTVTTKPSPKKAVRSGK